MLINHQQIKVSPRVHKDQETQIVVTVYSASWCAFCHATMEYLDKLGVQYEVKDIESDRAFAEESIEKSGQMGIPVIDIAGDIVIGFDRPKIDDSLAKHNLVKA